MIKLSFMPLVSALVSIVGIVIVILIFKKVYQEKYRKPWLFLSFTTISLAAGQLIRFAENFFETYIINKEITDLLVYILDFVAISTLMYAFLLEYMILKYVKGKFIKMKFIPVQEGTIGGEIDLNISEGNSYIALKKKHEYMLSQFSQATKKGFEGFLITENNPQEIRKKYQMPKTPIAWITQINKTLDSTYLRDSLDSNSDVLDPLQLNSLISYVDNFLEQAKKPFVMLDLNMMFRTNNYSTVVEFLKYLKNKIERSDSIFIGLLNIDILHKEQIQELKEFLIDLE